jgi:hypothetical protein
VAALLTAAAPALRMVRPPAPKPGPVAKAAVRPPPVPAGKAAPRAARAGRPAGGVSAAQLYQMTVFGRLRALHGLVHPEAVYNTHPVSLATNGGPGPRYVRVVAGKGATQGAVLFSSRANSGQTTGWSVDLLDLADVGQAFECILLAGERLWAKGTWTGEVVLAGPDVSLLTPLQAAIGPWQGDPPVPPPAAGTPVPVVVMEVPWPST